MAQFHLHILLKYTLWVIEKLACRSLYVIFTSGTWLLLLIEIGLLELPRSRTAQFARTTNFTCSSGTAWHIRWTMHACLDIHLLIHAGDHEIDPRGDKLHL